MRLSDSGDGNAPVKPTRPAGHFAGNALAVVIGLGLFAGAWFGWVKLREHRTTVVYLFSTGQPVEFVLDGQKKPPIAGGTRTLELGPGTHAFEFFDKGASVGRVELVFPRDSNAVVVPLPGQCFGVFRADNHARLATLSEPFDLAHSMHFDPAEVPSEDPEQSSLVEAGHCAGPPRANTPTAPSQTSRGR